ncbi:hypothetical protein [Paenibacillus illinoisensis]|uniref:hypothetical protein n=1 Tax=Paenibacillus illinoisensis TaxID=59845 RepID=UPI00301DBF4A
MKTLKFSIIFLLLFSLVACAGDETVRYEKSKHWNLALQKSTGMFTLTYVGDESLIKDFRANIKSEKTEQYVKSLDDEKTPFSTSATISESEETNGPITFDISWNGQSETIIFK